MKFVIVGRSSTGKSALAQALVENGMTPLQTVTTREPRTNDPTDSVLHRFISQAEADLIDPAKKLLPTNLGSYEYFTTAADLAAADVIVIEPDGINALSEAMPDESIRLVHCVCADEDARKKANQKALVRSADPAAEAVRFAERLQAEDARFTKFEDDLTHNETFGFNSLLTYTFNNDFTEECLQRQVAVLLSHRRKVENLREIARQCIRLGVLESSEPEHVDVVYENPEPFVKSIPLDLYLDTLFYSDQNMSALMHSWLSHKISLGEPEELVLDALNAEDPHDELFTEEALSADADAMADDADCEELNAEYHDETAFTEEAILAAGDAMAEEAGDGDA